MWNVRRLLWTRNINLAAGRPVPLHAACTALEVVVLSRRRVPSRVPSCGQPLCSIAGVCSHTKKKRLTASVAIAKAGIAEHRTYLFAAERQLVTARSLNH